MGFDYKCTGDPGMELASWDGHVEVKTVRRYFCEAEVSARGSSFHVICGHHSYGNYLCIPDWSIGSELGYLGDRFWNLERLTGYFPELSRVDAISIVDGLAAISREVNLSI